MIKKPNPLFEEQEIPKEVMIKLKQHRKELVESEQQKKQTAHKISGKIQLLIFITMIAAIGLMILSRPQNNNLSGSQMSDSTENIIDTIAPTPIINQNPLGISQDLGVATVESYGISTATDLKSVDNDLEITLTKFVATRKKYAFDYQFKIEDEELKLFLEKEIAANSNQQFIEYGLFVDGNSEDITGGEFIASTFRVEEDVFYGSVVSTFNSKKIPQAAQLSLQIYLLSWQDREEFDAKVAQLMINEESFSVDNILAYEGNWLFDLPNKPLTQTAQPHSSYEKNVTDIKSSSDALQTTVTFSIPYDDNIYPETKIYQNGVEKNVINFETYNESECTLSFQIVSSIKK